MNFRAIHPGRQTCVVYGPRYGLGVRWPGSGMTCRRGVGRHIEACLREAIKQLNFAGETALRVLPTLTISLKLVFSVGHMTDDSQDGRHLPCQTLQKVEL